MKKKIKEYKNDDLTVIWDANKCIHAGICVKKLPEVYKPKERPWIKLENAEKKELIEQINACPSGALSYKLLNQEHKKESKVIAKVIKNGPLRILGTINIEMVDGEIIEKGPAFGICRCGESKNKPFCDGTHKAIGWKG